MSQWSSKPSQLGSALGGPHSLWALSSEAVPTPFPILTRAHLDRGTLSRVMRHRNTSSHWLRVLSSEAVLNPFPPVPHFFPTNTELDEFRILRGQSFEPVDCDGILKIGRKLGIGTSGGAAGFQAGAAPI